MSVLVISLVVAMAAASQTDTLCWTSEVVASNMSYGVFRDGRLVGQTETTDCALNVTSKGKQLWVVEPKTDMAAEHLERECAARLCVWVGGSAVYATEVGVTVKDQLKPFVAGNSTIVSVPRSPVRYVRSEAPEHVRKYINGTNQAPNPIIVDALKQIRIESLREHIEMLQAYHTRQSQSSDALQVEAFLASELIRLGFQVSTDAFRDGFSANVVAELVGTEFPDEYIICGAHYDSRSTDASDPTLRAPGADDNGSGSSHILELARIISSLKLQFKYSIRLVLFSGEEQGLLGSRAYAKKLADSGTKVVAMFNGDMLGYRLPGTKITVGMQDRYISDWLLAVANTLAGIYIPELIVGVTPACCSDHQSFTENGFPAIGYFENEGSATDYPHYHKSTDLIENIEMENMLLISQAMAATTMTFAVPDLD